MAVALGAHPVAQREYGSVLFWVLDARYFAEAVLSKLHVDGLWKNIAGRLTASMVAADNLVRGRHPRGDHSNLRIDRIPLYAIDGEFSDLWQDKLTEEPRMLAERMPETLRWHFKIRGARKDVRVFVCREEGRLAGYLVMTRESPSDIGLKRARVADLLVRKNEPKVIENLLVAAYHDAQAAGNHVLEVLGFPGFVRDICRKWRPYARNYPACPYYYRTKDPALQQDLAHENAWYACPYDGDATLVP
jgi:hypothetical protein